VKIYVSSSFHDREYAKFASEVLRGLGHTITYEWWSAEYNVTHGENLSAEDNLKQRQLLAACEINAVVAADAVVQIGGGRRGAAAELGACLSHGKQAVLVLPESEMIHHPADTSVFWLHPCAKIVKVSYLDNPTLNRVLNFVVHPVLVGMTQL
jgi:hypothetical protein